MFTTGSCKHLAGSSGWNLCCTRNCLGTLAKETDGWKPAGRPYNKNAKKILSALKTSIFEVCKGKISRFPWTDLRGRLSNLLQYSLQCCSDKLGWFGNSDFQYAVQQYDKTPRHEIGTDFNGGNFHGIRRHVSTCFKLQYSRCLNLKKWEPTNEPTNSINLSFRNARRAGRSLLIDVFHELLKSFQVGFRVLQLFLQRLLG